MFSGRVVRRLRKQALQGFPNSAIRFLPRRPALCSRPHERGDKINSGSSLTLQAGVFDSKAKQCLPVDKNTSIEGRFLHFTPKSRQERGKAGSQVILKCLQRKQSGALSGIVSDLLSGKLPEKLLGIYIPPYGCR